MTEDRKVIYCAGLGWIALWTCLIWITLWTTNNHLRSIAESQRRIAAVYPIVEVDPNTIINLLPVEEEND